MNSEVGFQDMRLQAAGIISLIQNISENYSFASDLLAVKLLGLKCLALGEQCQLFKRSLQSKPPRDREMEEKGGRRRRLVLVPYPLQGHITPMLQLGTILHSRGFSITVAHSQFNSPDTSNHPDFVFLPLSDDSLSKYNPFDDIVDSISYHNLTCRVSLQELLIEMIEKQQERHEEQLPCIIFDSGMYCAEAVAHRLKLPSIMFRTSCAALTLSFYVCPKIQKEGYTPFQGM
ncbi:hypothetical protein QYF36_015531 [Acer negundo]|nr:hypothetical protein QYF36_015531 [Acer negundo]